MITTLSEEIIKPQRRGQIKDFEVAFHKLDEFVDVRFDQDRRLQFVQQVYLQDYKQQVKNMSKQLQILRDNFDSEILYQKSSEKMYVLQEQRNFFRSQVFKLSQEINQFIEENKILKKKVAELNEEIKDYKKVSINLEKKLQKIIVERNQINCFKRQESAPSLRIVKQEELREAKEEVVTNQQKYDPCRVTFFQRKGLQTMRMRTYSKVETATKASIKRCQENIQRDNLIDDCIKEIKKDIHSRKIDPKSNASPLQEISKITFDKFTRTDKKNLIIKLLNNQRLVEEFREFLTSRHPSEAVSRIVKTKILDEKFNDKFLSDLKKSFNKKILDIKSRPLTRERYDIQKE